MKNRHALFKPFSQWWVSRVACDGEWYSVRGLRFGLVLQAVGVCDGRDFSDR